MVLHLNSSAAFGHYITSSVGGWWLLDSGWFIVHEGSCASLPRAPAIEEPSIRNSPILHPVVLAYSHGTSTIPLIGQTIGENLRETARRFPERDALVVPFQRVRLTYADFDSTVDTLALSLVGAGIAKGDRVGIWSPNSAEWVVIQYAAARAGAILVNLNPAYRTTRLSTRFASRNAGCSSRQPTTRRAITSR